MVYLSTDSLSFAKSGMTLHSQLNEIRGKVNDASRSVTDLTTDLIILLFFPDILASIENAETDEKSNELRAQYQKLFANLTLDRGKLLDDITLHRGVKLSFQNEEQYIEGLIKAEEKRAEYEMNSQVSDKDKDINS